MSVVTLLGVDPVEGQLVAFPKTSLKFVGVGESVKLESGAVVIVSFSFLSESKQESWLLEGFSGQVNGVVIVPEPLLFSSESLVQPLEGFVVLAELKLVVTGPISVWWEHIESQMPVVVIKVSVGLDTSVPVEWSVVNFIDAMVVWQGQCLGKDFSIQWSVVFNIEPKFSFTGWGQWFSLLVEDFLDVESTVGWLDVGLDSQNFFVDEIILQDWVWLLLEWGPWLILVWSSFRHFGYA